MTVDSATDTDVKINNGLAQERPTLKVFRADDGRVSIQCLSEGGKKQSEDWMWYEYVSNGTSHTKVFDRSRF